LSSLGQGTGGRVRRGGLALACRRVFEPAGHFALAMTLRTTSELPLGCRSAQASFQKPVFHEENEFRPAMITDMNAIPLMSGTRPVPPNLRGRFTSMHTNVLPEIDESELKAVRNFLISHREEERAARRMTASSACGEVPLRTGIARARTRRQSEAARA
jgi:hypothetical protein